VITSATASFWDLPRIELHQRERMPTRLIQNRGFCLLERYYFVSVSCVCVRTLLYAMGIRRWLQSMGHRRIGGTWKMPILWRKTSGLWKDTIFQSTQHIASIPFDQVQAHHHQQCADNAREGEGVNREIQKPEMVYQNGSQNLPGHHKTSHIGNP
jgi:hypothetical protein